MQGCKVSLTTTDFKDLLKIGMLHISYEHLLFFELQTLKWLNFGCRYRQIGNAVAVPVSRALGFALATAWLKKSGDEPLMTLPPKFSFSLNHSILYTLSAQPKDDINSISTDKLVERVSSAFEPEMQI